MELHSVPYQQILGYGLNDKHASLLHYSINYSQEKFNEVWDCTPSLTNKYWAMV